MLEYERGKDTKREIFFLREFEVAPVRKYGGLNDYLTEDDSAYDSFESKTYENLIS